MIKLEITGEHAVGAVILGLLAYIVFNVTSCANQEAELARQARHAEQAVTGLGMGGK